ncbi:MAG: spondin domain-containing protein [Phycisphaerales bacterium]
MRTHTTLALALLAATATANVHADIINIQVQFQNLAPDRGTFQTPVWLGFHNGQFDTYDRGVAASAALERLAEDGTVGPLSTLFSGSGFGSQDGTLFGANGVIAPSEVTRMHFVVDSDDPRAQYFSYASMVIPSNDAFVANGNPLAHRLFDNQGNFLGADFFITGADVLDAGTEVNDEIPMNTAFFGQQNPNTGTTENGVVHLHPGYIDSFGNPGGTRSILAAEMFRGADFTLPGYPIGRFTIRVVPAPAAMALFGLASLISTRRRRSLD